MISNMVLDGLEAVVCGGSWQRRVHNINYVRWAAAFIVTAHAREVLAEVVLPRITAVLPKRSGRLSTEKTVITPISQGVDFLEQTLRKHARPNDKPAKLQITPITDPVTGPQLLRVREAVKPQRHIKLKGDANPFAHEWEAYFQHRDW